MLLGQARGAVGDLVFSRQNGKQITRSRARVVKNPRTEAQMIQRIIQATVSQAYSRMAVICNHSFEGVKPGQDSMSFFTSKNLNTVRSRMVEEIRQGYGLDSVYAYTPISTNVYASNRFIISKGTLPEINLEAFSGNVANLAVGGSTYGDIIATLGLQRGDQLTFVATQGTTGERQVFSFARVILDPTNADGSAAALDTPFLADGDVNLPSPRNEGNFATLQLADGILSFNFSAQPITGAAVIASRKNAAGNWQRSNSTMEVYDANVAGWQYSMQDCLDLLATGGVETLSDRYLNNAGSGKLAGGNGAAVTVQTAAGATVTLVGMANGVFKNEDGEDVPVLVAVDTAGNQYAIKNAYTASREYGKFLADRSGWGDDAWEALAATSATAAKTVDVSGPEGEMWDWLVANGVSYQVWVTKP